MVTAVMVMTEPIIVGPGYTGSGEGGGVTDGRRNNGEVAVTVAVVAGLGAPLQ